MSTNLTRKLSLRLRVFLFFALIAAIGIAFIGLGLWLASRYGGTLSGLALGGMVASAGLIAISLWVWFKFDEHVVAPVVALANTLKTNANADQLTALEAVRAQAPYLGDLGPSVDSAIRALLQTRADTQSKIASQTQQLAQEKARIEALLHDLSEGVLVCSMDHRITLFNRAALEALGQKTGLGRGIGHVVIPDSVEHALSRLLARHARAPQDHPRETLMVETSNGDHVLQGHMTLMRDDHGPFGYILALQDITDDLHARAIRRAELRQQAQALEDPAQVLAQIAAGETPAPQAISAARSTLEGHIGNLLSNSLTTRQRHWPMGTVSCRELAETVSHLLSTGAQLRTEGCPSDALIHCDEYAIAHSMAALIKAGPEDCALMAHQDESGVQLCLHWPKGAPAADLVEATLDTPLPAGYGENCLRDALEGHGITLCVEPDRLILPLTPASRTREDAPAPHRPEFYDFALPPAPDTDALRDTPLDKLNFVVFDTETTGLNPAGGDEIVEIAAVRIVNNRILRGDIFAALVNPGRRIPAAATKIHGISDARVADAPSISEIGANFHEFSEDAVLVAHNAPFDMAFLRRKQAKIGRDFTNPVLDTVMLSALLFGQEGDHTLDALMTRFGIHLPEERRHTAMGDTEATAEVFLHLLSMARAEGYTTLGQVQDATVDIRAIRRKQAVYDPA